MFQGQALLWDRQDKPGKSPQVIKMENLRSRRRDGPPQNDHSQTTAVLKLYAKIRVENEFYKPHATTFKSLLLPLCPLRISCLQSLFQGKGQGSKKKWGERLRPVSGTETGHIPARPQPHSHSRKEFSSHLRPCWTYGLLG